MKIRLFGLFRQKNGLFRQKEDQFHSIFSAIRPRSDKADLLGSTAEERTETVARTVHGREQRQETGAVQERE